MIDNPLSYLNELFELFAARKVSGHDQLICLHIYNKFNRSYWTDTIQIADRELQDLCRLYDSTGKPISIDTIRKAKSRLKLKGLIDFKAGKGTELTEYRLPKLCPTDTPTNTPTNTPTDIGLVSYTHMRNASATRTDETPPPSPPPFPPAPPFFSPLTPRKTKMTMTTARAREAAGQNETATSTNSLAGALPLRSPKMKMGIHDLWKYETGYSLYGSTALELEQLANENFELMHEAIIRGVQGSGGQPKFKYVKVIFESLKKEGEKVGKPKGTSKNEQSEPKFREPKYSGCEEWQDFDESEFYGEVPAKGNKRR